MEPPGASVEQGLHELAGEEPRRAEIGSKDDVEIARIELKESARCRDPEVVHEQRDRAMLGDDPVAEWTRVLHGCVRHNSRLRRRGKRRPAPPSSLVEPRERVLRRSRQTLRDRETDSVRRARYQGGLRP